MEAQFYSVEVEGSDFPELSEIIDKFGEIHTNRGRPDGDALEQQMDAMMYDTCQHFNIKFLSMPDDVYIFYPMDMDLDRDELIKMIEQSGDE